MHLDQFEKRISSKQINSLLSEHFNLNISIAKLNKKAVIRIQEQTSKKLGRIRNSSALHESQNSNTYLSLLMLEGMLKVWLKENRFLKEELRCERCDDEGWVRCSPRKCKGSPCKKCFGDRWRFCPKCNLSGKNVHVNVGQVNGVVTEADANTVQPVTDEQPETQTTPATNTPASPTLPANKGGKVRGNGELRSRLGHHALQGVNFLKHAKNAWDAGANRQSYDTQFKYHPFQKSSDTGEEDTAAEQPAADTQVTTTPTTTVNTTSTPNATAQSNATAQPTSNAPQLTSGGAAPRQLGAGSTNAPLAPTDGVKRDFAQRSTSQPQKPAGNGKVIDLSLPNRRLTTGTKPATNGRPSLPAPSQQRALPSSQQHRALPGSQQRRALPAPQNEGRLRESTNPDILASFNRLRNTLSKANMTNEQRTVMINNLHNLVKNHPELAASKYQGYKKSVINTVDDQDRTV